MEKFENLNNAEIVTLKSALFMIIDDYEQGAWDDETEYEIALVLYKELETELKKRGFAND